MLHTLAVFGFQKKYTTKSLEELAIIIEVLEEDLRTNNICRSPSQTLSCSSPLVPPEWSPTGNSWGADPHLYSSFLKHGSNEYINSNCYHHSSQATSSF